MHAIYFLKSILTYLDLVFSALFATCIQSVMYEVAKDLVP